ncbi:MAG: n-acetylglutamate synthase [Chloroflexota bacterium]
MYNNRTFKSIRNSGSGEVDVETRFHYRQIDNVVWATYSGGAIKHGTLNGLVNTDGSLDFCYSHVNQEDVIMTGRCHSTPETLPDGRLRMHETWTWTSGDRSSGVSMIEEVRP